MNILIDMVSNKPTNENKRTGFTSQSALGKIRQIHGDFIHLVHLITLVCFTSMMIMDLGLLVLQRNSEVLVLMMDLFFFQWKQKEDLKMQKRESPCFAFISLFQSYVLI